MRNIITKILMTCMLAVFCVMAAAQDVVKLRTSEYALRFADDNGQWGEWSEWKVSSMPVVGNKK